MKTYLSELNDAQRAPVEHLDGPLMIIAGAGSGKTRVLTYRIANLISKGAEPHSILALTFTNKAAREMKKRIGDIVGSAEAKNLWMGTFHSVFARLLRFESDRLGFPSNFSIYDTQDSQSLIRSIIKDMGLDSDIYKYKQVSSRISSYKNSLITVKAYHNSPELIEADAMARRPRIGEIYREYVERCFKAAAMDFDDLLLRTNELLTRFPEVLMKYQDKFRHIMVDEYQDTNHSQYLIVRALSDRFQNICVVGDDSQSIYGFRGANISNILNFKKDYKDAVVYRLEQNYRSTKNIVKAANSVIEKNKNRLEKEIWTHNEDGAPIKVHRSESDSEEGRFVARSIFENKMQNQLKNGCFAVLYRTNSQSRAIEDALRKLDIPYRIYGGLSFYQRKEVKDVLAYLRLLVNPKDEEALLRIINFPARGIGQTTIDRLAVFSNHYKKPMFEVIENLDKVPDVNIHSGTRAKLSNFILMIKHLQIQSQTQDAFTMADAVIKKTGLLQELKKDGTPEGISRLENIDGLLSGIRDFVENQKDKPDAQGTLSEFLEDIALSTDLDSDIADEDRVALMTIHLAKGLEFPYVYVVGLEENLFPSAMSTGSKEDIEEERRLFYVALTRAERQAYVTYAENRYRYGRYEDAEPSRFIQEIDQNYVEHLTLPRASYQYNPPINADVFDDIDKSKLRQYKPINGRPPAHLGIKDSDKLKPKKVFTANADTADNTTPFKSGQRVKHSLFGSGVIVAVEGYGSDTKAVVNFDNGTSKTMLTRYAKLEVLGEQ